MDIDRRTFIQSLGLGLPIINSNKSDFFIPFNEETEEFKKNFNSIKDRVWLGKEFWSIPLEDWSVRDGKVVFDGSFNGSRTHFLTKKLSKDDGSFLVKAKCGVLKIESENASVGFSLGILDRQTDKESTVSNCYFGEGIELGVALNKVLFIGSRKYQIDGEFNFDDFEIIVSGETNKGQTSIKLEVLDKEGKKYSLIENVSENLEGLICLHHQLSGSSFWWDQLYISGQKIVNEKEEVGPVVWCMYTLSEGDLKLTAQLMPIGQTDSQNVHLEIFRNNQWQRIGTSKVDVRAFIARFSINEWGFQEDINYRVLYKIDGINEEYTGTIRREPTNGKLILGALTCQNDMGFPYRPLVENLENKNPDMLYFSGDQIYEGNGGYPIKRFPEDKAILSYLGKWFMFGLAFGNIMKDRPTICTPDDHDVFQGNLWGEGGEHVSLEEWAARKDARGGYVQSTLMVNVVHLTQCSHLPNPIVKEMLPSGISTWFTGLKYGRISFAIVSDRLFKSGPEMIRKGVGRIDHVRFKLEKDEVESDELSLMGNLQTAFMEDWIVDWDNADMKVMLSQTIFANVATHHGPKQKFLQGDMDSGGWPKRQRDEILRIMRKAEVFHINGDQHLPFIVKYGIERPKDGGWAFCTPAIATGYPRWSKPDQVNIPHIERPIHNLANTGLYKDVFGNENFVFAVGNPAEEFDFELNRYRKANLKASGFGLVTFSNVKREIKMEAFRFLASSTEEKTYPGWPLTIHQSENDGRQALGYLPLIKSKNKNQILKVFVSDRNEIVHSIRIQGYEHRPRVYENTSYRIELGEKETLQIKDNVEISRDSSETLFF
ncbi:alkaline phosphatase D family protein [uncultured Arcticibacterium sp.]|uniref:alkaline phosphatase D family protein n=1 Tax=uncultured Arcticibacterium sp. TaxID=2173042 RepID=UPI0030FAB884